MSSPFVQRCDGVIAFWTSSRPHEIVERLIEKHFSATSVPQYDGSSKSPTINNVDDVRLPHRITSMMNIELPPLWFSALNTDFRDILSSVHLEVEGIEARRLQFCWLLYLMHHLQCFLIRCCQSNTIETDAIEQFDVAKRFLLLVYEKTCELLSIQPDAQALFSLMEGINAKSTCLSLLREKYLLDLLCDINQTIKLRWTKCTSATPGKSRPATAEKSGSASLRKCRSATPRKTRQTTPRKTRPATPTESTAEPLKEARPKPPLKTRLERHKEISPEHRHEIHKDHIRTPVVQSSTDSRVESTGIGKITSDVDMCSESSYESAETTLELTPSRFDLPPVLDVGRQRCMVDQLQTALGQFGFPHSQTSAHERMNKVETTPQAVTIGVSEEIVIKEDPHHPWSFPEECKLYASVHKWRQRVTAKMKTTKRTAVTTTNKETVTNDKRLVAWNFQEECQLLASRHRFYSKAYDWKEVAHYFGVGRSADALKNKWAKLCRNKARLQRIRTALRENTAAITWHYIVNVSQSHYV